MAEFSASFLRSLAMALCGFAPITTSTLRAKLLPLPWISISGQSGPSVALELTERCLELGEANCHLVREVLAVGTLALRIRQVIDVSIGTDINRQQQQKQQHQQEQTQVQQCRKEADSEIWRELCHAIDDVLDGFTETVASLDEAIESNIDGMVSLHTFRSKISPHRTELQYLFELVEAGDTENLLERLHASTIAAAGTVAESSIMVVSDRCNRVLTQQLISYATTGSASAGVGRFLAFNQASAEVLRPWAIVPKLVPPQLPNAVAETVAFCGWAATTFRKCSGGSKDLWCKPRCEALLVWDCLSKEHELNSAFFRESLQSLRMSAEERLWNEAVVCGHAKDFFRVVRVCVLLGRGDVVQTVEDVLGDDLRTFIRGKNAHRSFNALVKEAAIELCVADKDTWEDKEVGVMFEKAHLTSTSKVWQQVRFVFDLKAPSSFAALRGWETVSISLQPIWPMSLIINSRQVQVYASIFRMLWLARAVSSLVSRGWRILRLNNSHQHPAWKKLRSTMLRVIRAMDAVITYMQGIVEQIFDRIQTLMQISGDACQPKANSFLRLVDEHAYALDFLQRALFLHKPALKIALERLLDSIATVARTVADIDITASFPESSISATKTFDLQVDLFYRTCSGMLLSRLGPDSGGTTYLSYLRFLHDVLGSVVQAADGSPSPSYLSFIHVSKS